jgi:protein-S-isoprenylcysteine O-methyltransferase Ste14
MSKKNLLILSAQAALGFTLLLTGWGWDDLDGFLRHPARAGFLAVGLLSLFLVFAFRLDVQVFRKGKRPLGRQRWWVAVVMLCALFFVWFLPHADRRSLLTFAGADLVRYLGLGLYTGGNALAFLAVRILGKQYSAYVTLQENHQLVTTGIYGLIRHPIYLRALMVSVGLPLLFRSWLVPFFFLLVSVFVGLRIRSEERLLAAKFGAEFDAYRRRTWRLLPYLY